MKQDCYAVVGVNGAGGISDIYLQNMIHRFPTLRVKSVCSRKPENARRKAEQFGVAAQTWEEMLADPEITMIVNLTPPDAHFQVISEALQAGKHVFTEKILTVTCPEGRQLCQLADRKGLYLGCAPETFMGSAVQTARRALDGGLIGSVVSFHIQANRNLDFLTSFSRFLRSPGGGIGKDYGVYYLTALISLLGPVKRVMGMTKSPRPVRTNIIPDHPEYGQEFRIADETQLYGMLELACGACGTMHLNGDSITQDEGGVTLYGEKGHLLLPCPNHMGGEVRLAPDSPVWDRRAEQRVLENRFFFQDNARGMGAAELARAVRHGERPRVSKEMAYHALEVFEALYDSAKSGAWREVRSVFERPRPMPSMDEAEDEAACFL